MPCRSRYFGFEKSAVVAVALASSGLAPTLSTGVRREVVLGLNSWPKMHERFPSRSGIVAHHEVNRWLQV
jgi:hypothetical protein